MLKALKKQNDMITGKTVLIDSDQKKREADKIIKKYKGKIKWGNKMDTKGIAYVPDDYRKYAMNALESAGFSVSETGFSSGFWVEF